MQKLGVANNLYNHKVSNDIHWGPHGFLIRETFSNAEVLGQHNYLAMPEIIQDIIRGYAVQFREDISSVYSFLLKPCIVKFSQPAGNHLQRIMPSAISYAYTSGRKEALRLFSVNGIDMKNSPVSYENITHVQYQ